MKHLKFILMMVVAANIALVTSCKKDEDDPASPTNENPAISLAGDNGNIAADVTLEPGEPYQFTLTASENANTKRNLDKLVVTSEVGGIVSTVVDTNISGKTFGPFTWMVNALTIETTQTWTFTVTDNGGKSGSTGFTVTTVAPVNSTPLATEKTGMYYHIQGTLKGAFDLVNDVEKGAADPDTDKDLKNTDGAGDPFTGSFQAANTSRFSPTTESYANILTVEKAEELYTNGGIPQSDIANPSAGDTYIVKLRNNEYAVLRIDSVDPADNTCSCANTGKMTFSYKKK